MTCISWGALDAVPRRAWETRKSVEPLAAWEAILAFEAGHAGHSGLSALTFGGDGSGLSLFALGPGGPCLTRGSLEAREAGDAVGPRIAHVAFPPGLPVGAG